MSNITPFIQKKMKFCPSCTTPLELKDRPNESLKVLSCPKCPYQFYNNPTPVIGAIIENEDGNIILVRSKGWPKNMFALVTGFLE